VVYFIITSLQPVFPNQVHQVRTV